MKKVVMFALFISSLAAPAQSISSGTSTAALATNSLSAADLDASDKQAVATLTSTVQSMGGSAAISNLHQWTIRATSHPGTNGGYEGAIIWKYLDGEFRSEIQKNGATNITVTGHGHPGTVFDGKLHPLSIRYAKSATFTPVAMAGILSKTIKDPTCRRTNLSSVKQSDGSTVNQIHLKCSPIVGLGSEHTWSFDSASNLPKRVDFLVTGPAPIHAPVPFAMVFSDYRSVQGVQIPFLMQLMNNEVLAQTIAIDSVDVLTRIDASEFDAKTGGAK